MRLTALSCGSCIVLVCMLVLGDVSTLLTSNFWAKAALSASAACTATSIHMGSKDRSIRRILHGVANETYHNAPNRSALVSLLLDTAASSYIHGGRVLLKSALRHAPGYFSAMELLVLKGRPYDPFLLEEARAAGWTLRWVDPIMPPHPSKFARFRDQFAKLHLWALEEYTEVVYMDLDAVFVGPLNGPITSKAAYPTDCKIWAARDIRASVWRDTFNMGVAGLRPSKKEFERLHTLMANDAVTYEHVMSEQGFLNAIYNSSNGAWCELEFEKNANLAAYKQKRAFWDAAKHLQVVHFTMNKPWDCKGEYTPVCNLWRLEAESTAAPVTVVTAYYPGPSKHGESKYVKWGRTMLKQKVPMVIFSDKRSSIPGIESRDPNLTRVVELSMNEFSVMRSYLDWNEQLMKDPEGKIHNTHMFKVWLEKTYFVMRAIQMNTFHSSHYVWVDFGCFRSQSWSAGNWTVHVERFPSSDRLLMLNAPKHHPRKKVAGTIFGGSVKAWQSWAPRFDELLSNSVRQGTFVGDDQILMSMIAERIPQLVCRVNATETGDDPWWYLQFYLAGKAEADTNCSAGAAGVAKQAHIT